MSFSHLLILGIIAVIVIPPEKLPEVARQVARFLGEMRRMTSGVFDDLKQDMILKPEDMLKKQQQNQQKQQQQQPAEPTVEEKKKAEDEYLKHIQGDSTSETTPEKKSDHE